MSKVPVKKSPKTVSGQSIIRRITDAAAEMLEWAYADFQAGAEIEPGDLTFVPGAFSAASMGLRDVRPV